MVWIGRNPNVANAIPMSGKDSYNAKSAEAISCWANVDTVTRYGFKSALWTIKI